MTASVVQQPSEAFETIKYQDCDLKVEPLMPNVPSGSLELMKPIQAKLEPGAGSVKSEVKNGKCYYCQDCGRTFKEAGNLRRHKDTVHDKLRNFSCQDCGKSFGEAGNLRRHKETVHEKVKNFYCKDCGKAFGEGGNLRRHKETVHDKVKNYFCQDCGKAFSERGNLKRHADTVHNGNKAVAIKKVVPVTVPAPLPVTYPEGNQQISHLVTPQIPPIQGDSAQYCTVTTIIPVVTCLPNQPQHHHLTHPQVLTHPHPSTLAQPPPQILQTQSQM